MLQRIGFFSLIGGYKQFFRIPNSKVYKEGTSFNEIMALYTFDAELRELFLKYLLQIERHVGNLISYYFVERFGIEQAEYLKPHNYDNSKQNQETVQRLIQKLYGATTTRGYEHINYYRATYGNIPLWVTTTVITFGSISKMYQVIPQPLKAKVSKHYECVNQKQLARYLSILAKYRNVCAHGDRLFTYKTVDQILDTALHMKLGIPRKGNQYIYGKQDLFAVVIAFRYLLPKEDFLNFKRCLGHRINIVCKSLEHISEKELLEQMGFPPNWRNISRYRIL